MRGYFDTSKRQIALVNEALSWIGTPFLLNSRRKGKDGGVSCHNLIYGIFEEMGIKLPFESPKGSGGVGDQTRLAKVSMFLEGQECFQEIGRGRKDLMAGDLISFRVKSGEYHLGLMLDGVAWLTFIHALKPMGVSTANLFDPTYGARLLSGWRLKHEDDWS